MKALRAPRRFAAVGSAVAAMFLLSLLTAADTPVASGSAELNYRTYRQWKLVLPQPQTATVGTAFGFENGIGARFATALEGTALKIDTDGDGTCDATAEGKSALITLRATKDGRELPYSIRLTNQGGWKYTAAGAMVGEIAGTKVQLIDQNLNGSYADYGEDALIVGRGRTASFLSRAVNIGGQLYTINVSADGAKLDYAPYTETTGTLHLGACKTNAKVLGAVVRSADNRFSFELSNATDGIQVPAGSYKVIGGRIGLGKNVVQFSTGRSKSIQVTPEETTKVSWGGPVAAEFAYQRAGDKLHLSPDYVWYYGAAGEEYHSWNPVGKSPLFTITDKKSGREIAQSYFPGTC